MPTPGIGGQPWITVVGDDYNGNWLDESTFAVTLITPSASTIEIGATVVQARQSLTVASSLHRPIRFKGGISAYSNGTSPPLRGIFGSGDRPVLSNFSVRDPDNADTSYNAYDELSMVFSMPTDRGGLTTLSGDKRFVDQYFDFSCNLGRDYTGTWSEPDRVTITVLDATTGHNPATVSDVHVLRVTPNPVGQRPHTPGFIPQGGR